jgi:hypothetical protein
MLVSGLRSWALRMGAELLLLVLVLVGQGW